MRILHLKVRRDFLRVARKGRKVVRKGLVLQACPCEEPFSSVCRVGVTATKKIGNAVCRNRAKRRLRAGIRELFQRARPGYDYVVIARYTTLKHPYPALLEDMKKALHALGAWQDKGA